MELGLVAKRRIINGCGYILMAAFVAACAVIGYHGNRWVLGMPALEMEVGSQRRAIQQLQVHLSDVGGRLKELEDVSGKRTQH